MIATLKTSTVRNNTVRNNTTLLPVAPWERNTPNSAPKDRETLPVRHWQRVGRAVKVQIAALTASAPYGIVMRAGGRKSRVSHSTGSSSSGSGSGFSRSSGRGSGAIGGIVVLAVIGLAGYLVWKRLKAKSPGQAAAIAGGAATLLAAGMAMAKAASEKSGQVGSTGGLDKIRSHDPSFDEATFLAAVERSFFLVQKAWCDQDPDQSRQVMADGIWQTHRTQIDEMKGRGRKSVMEELGVDRCTIVSADSNASKDTIVVRVEAHAKDFEVEIASGKRKDGDRSTESWVEQWTYQRASSASTKTDGGTMNQKCPNCGAPLKVDLAGICKYCKANIMAGDHDWVLTHIDD